MKLYGTPPTRATRALWLIRELGLDCEIVFLSLRRGEHRRPELLALNPAGRVPFLVDGDLVLTESVAICLYLAEKCPRQSLIPACPVERAQMFRWLFFSVTEIESALERMERHTSLYPEEKRSLSEVELAREECLAMLDILETHMAEREYLSGARVSVADMVCAYTLDWAREGGLLSHKPGLSAYLERMYSRPKAPPTVAQAFAALRAGLDPCQRPEELSER